MLITIAVVLSLAVGIGLGVVLLRPKLQVARARLADAEVALSRQREDFDRTLSNLENTFKGISADVLKESRDEFMKQAEPRIAEHVRPLQDALKRYEEAVRAIESKREDAYGGLKSHLKLLEDYTHRLKEETGNLRSALKSPTMRGRWGEVTLRRVVELAGMSKHCDFDEQVVAEGSEGRLRPDMVVRLPGGRSVVVDAKAPLDAYMKAVESADEDARAVFITQHARAVREHMRKLGQKSYWEQFDSSTDLVVLFLPGESFFAAALEMDRSLFEDGMQSRVILATPATLIALLRSFAMGWQQEQLAENAALISDAGKELFERCAKFADHFDGVGGGLEKAIRSFNSAVGSWESRVVPGAKRLKELGATKNPDAELPEVKQVETAPRQMIDTYSDIQAVIASEAPQQTRGAAKQSL